MSSFGGIYRRVEQGLLQSVGLAQSSLKADASFTVDSERLERLEATLRKLAESQSAHISAARRSNECALEYIATVDRALTSAGRGVGAALRIDASPIVRLVAAQRAAVGASATSAANGALARVGRVLIDVATLRADFGQRVDRVLDVDSYVRRVEAAKAALAGAAAGASTTEAAEVLRKASGKERDAAALVAQLSARIRSRLTALEETAASEANEAALSFLAAFAHESVHAAEASHALLPRFPGAAIHTAELTADSGARAESIISVAPAALAAAAAAPTPVANSLAAALRSPHSVHGAGATIDAAPFSAIHAVAMPSPPHHGEHTRQCIIIKSTCYTCETPWSCSWSNYNKCNWRWNKW